MFSDFDQRQKGSVNAILDKWYTTNSDDFIFPIIDGPPGTGKTTIGANAVAQYLNENPNKSVLYMCYTNFAADSAQRTLQKQGLKPGQIIRITANSMDKNWKDGVVGVKWDCSNITRDEERRLKACSVLLCTLHRSRLASKLRSIKTRVIVDEFSQVNPSMFFSTINRIRYLNPEGYALLGDPNQLPIVTTQNLLLMNIKDFIIRRKPYTPHELDYQYRMHQDICAAVNSLRRALGTYDIKTAEHVKNRDLENLDPPYRWNSQNVSPDLREILAPQYPCVIVNTDGLGGQEERGFRGSVKNSTEANLACRLAQEFYKSYMTESGEHLIPTILTPYNAQLSEISQKLPPHLRQSLTTIYKAQGKEYDCVIISFVRNNPKKFIGFLKEPYLKAQTYVACSRAKAKLVILLSFSTFLESDHIDFNYLCETKSAHIVDVK